MKGQKTPSQRSNVEKWRKSGVIGTLLLTGLI
jgi:hypothetical protein